MIPSETYTVMPAEAIGEKLYDLSMISRLCRDNQQQILKMIRVFQEESTTAVREIKEAYRQQDFPRLKSLAHKVKPTFAYYNIVKLDAIIKRIERLAKEEKSVPELVEKILHLEEILTQVVEHMNTEFQKPE